MNTKAFYKSKAFYGCVSTIVLIVGDIASSGANPRNVMALMTAALALYGRIVATQPLGIGGGGVSAASERDVEQARADVRTGKINADADRGD